MNTSNLTNISRAIGANAQYGQAMASQPSPVSAPLPRLVKLPEVMSITALGKSSIYALMQDAGPNRFPASVAIGGRAVAWRLHDVLAWVDSRQSKGGAA